MESETATCTEEKSVCNEPVKVGQNKELCAFKHVSTKTSTVAATSSADVALQRQSNNIGQVAHMEIEPAIAENVAVDDFKEEKPDLSLMHISLHDENINENNDSDCVIVLEYEQHFGCDARISTFFSSWQQFSVIDKRVQAVHRTRCQINVFETVRNT